MISLHCVLCLEQFTIWTTIDGLYSIDVSDDTGSSNAPLSAVFTIHIVAVFAE